jgi:hypothetical protein
MKYRRRLDPKASPVPALVVWAFGLAVLLVACNDPVGPAKFCEPCGFALNVPPLDQVEAAMRLGWQQARETCPGVGPFESYQKPRVDWQPCWFLARGGSVCAAGAAYASEGFIRVSTQEPERTLPLVTWESRNLFWLLGGCGGKAI